MDENIYLIGFMGSGKSTFGQALAKRLGYKWVDFDHYIEQQQNLSIKEIFECFGEAHFRALETQCLKSFTVQKHCIVSTGGGIIMMPENVAHLKTQKTFYLKWDFDTLYERVKADENRPLVKSYEQLLALYQKRQTLYEKAASKIIEAEGKSLEQIITQMIEYMEATNEDRSH